MLIIKAYINHRQIDEIWIHNIGAGYSDPELGEFYIYKIEKPKGYEKELVLHHREDGWQLLGEKALKILKAKK